MTFNRIILFLALLFLSFTSMAQGTISAEIRPRTEYNHGVKALAFEDQEPGLFTSQRSRLNFGYTSPSYDLYVCLQDIRTWGNTSQLVVADGAFSSIHEGWALARLNERLSLKLGRQEINLDDQRIFGAVAWAQQARSHDAALLQYQDDSAGIKMQFGVAYNQEGPNLIGNVYRIPKSYKTFQYLWFHKDFKHLNLSVLALNLGQDAVKRNSHATLFNQTLGFRTSYKKEKLKWNLAFYQQLGLTGDTLETQLNAQLLSLDASFSLSSKLEGTLGFEYLSGQSETEAINTADYTETLRSFNPYFGTNHKFNGVMDYFYVGNHAGSVGLVDLYAKLAYKEEKWKTSLAVHSFSAAADVLDRTKLQEDNTVAAMSSGLGTEIDITFGTNLVKGVALDLGYSQMLGTETLVAIRGGSTSAISNWAYAMFTFNPSFLQ